MEFIFRLIPLIVIFIIISRFLQFISKFVLDFGNNNEKTNNKKHNIEETKQNDMNNWKITEDNVEKNTTPNDFYNIDEAVPLSEQTESLTDRKKTEKTKEVKKTDNKKNSKSSHNIFNKHILDKNNIEQEILRGVILKEILDKPRAKNPYKIK